VANLRRFAATIVMALLAALVVLPGVAGAGAPNVYVVRIDNMQEIDQAAVQMLERAFDLAEADVQARGEGSAAVAIVLDTPGGLVTSAMRMQERILHSKARTLVLVQDNAISAGALVATAAEKLYMQTGSRIGAAEPRYRGSTAPADYKTMSVWIGAFRSTAEARKRDPNIAQAMVDTKSKIAGQTTELLVLSAQEAVDKKYADGIAGDLNDALKQAGIAGTQVTVEPTMSERFGRLLTIPWVAVLLLIVGVIAIGVEFIKPGVAVPGFIGIVCLGLFFLGNVLVGTAGLLEVGLAFLGIVLLVVEAFVPGFGVFGIGGLISVAASIFMSVPSTTLATSYLMWATLAFTVALFGIVQGISKRGLGKALTLERDARGQVPPRADLSRLVGREGKALTVLRPAGTALFGSEKVDVVTEGEFVSAGAAVRVIQVDGARVVVRVLGQ